MRRFKSAFTLNSKKLARLKLMHYFILGPSGSGKSTFAAHAAEIRRAWFLETDLWGKDGMVELGLKQAWDSFHQCRTFEPLCAELDARASRADKTGCIVSLPGFPVLTVRHLRIAGDRARLAYLSGSPGQCLDAFLAREQATGRGLGIQHWTSNTESFFQALSQPDISPLVIPAFEPNGQRRTADAILAEIDSISI